MDTLKLKEHKLLNEISKLFKHKGSVGLVGGAVIDILEGRKPKDYDFVGLHDYDIENLINNGFVFMYSSKTAFTLYKGGETIQLLKNDIKTFDYTISQANYNLRRKNLTIDKASFDNKILIPTSHTFENKGKAINALKRVPHYNRKGYTLPDETYLSLLNRVSYNDGMQS